MLLWRVSYFKFQTILSMISFFLEYLKSIIVKHTTHLGHQKCIVKIITSSPLPCSSHLISKRTKLHECVKNRTREKNKKKCIKTEKRVAEKQKIFFNGSNIKERTSTRRSILNQALQATTSYTWSEQKKTKIIKINSKWNLLSK